MPAPAEQFLRILGKDPATTFVSAIFHQRKPGDGSRSRLDARGLDTAALKAENRAGASIYFVTGDADQGTGRTGAVNDVDITYCRALFAEWDDRPKDWQLNAWRDMDLPEPSAQVDTGGKSVHTYWVLSEPMEPDQWRVLQRRLLEHTGGDKQCKNPSRLMRLPGFHYVDKKTGEITDRCAELIHQSDVTYSVEEIEACLPPSTASNTSKPFSIKLASVGSQSPRGLDEIRAAAEYIAERISGRNSDSPHHYETCRRALCGCAAALKEIDENPELALDLLAHKWPDRSTAEQVLRSSTTFNAGSFWAIAREQGYNLRRHPQAADHHKGGTDMDLACSGLHLNKTELLEFLRTTYRLEFNELTRVSEIDGNPLGDLAQLADVFLAEQHGIEVNKQTAADSFAYLAKAQPYNPIARYLEGLRDRKSELRLVSMEELAFAFAIEPGDQLSERLLASHLAGAVLRGLNPGYKHDQILILSGEQGTGKSEVIAQLASPAWYDSATRVEDLEAKDFLAKVNGCWIFEVEECEHALLKRTASEFKSFVTRTNDRYVEKYEKEAKTHQRRSVLFGTTNQAEFLNDNTGNRRAWVIPTGSRRTNPSWVATNRDSIWATVLTWIDWGLRNYVPPGDQLALEAADRAQNANLSDPWEGALLRELASVRTDPAGGIAQDELIQRALQIPLDRVDRSVQMRIARIVTGHSFRTHGGSVAWRSQKRRWGGGSPRAGYVPQRVAVVPSVPTTESLVPSELHEVGSPQPPWYNKDLTTLFQAVPTFSEGVNSSNQMVNADTNSTVPTFVPKCRNSSEHPQNQDQAREVSVPISSVRSDQLGTGLEQAVAPEEQRLEEIVGPLDQEPTLLDGSESFDLKFGQGRHKTVDISVTDN
jgi:hypothetical protein